MPTKVSTFTTRAVAKKAIPAFEKKARAKCKFTDKSLEVSFPGAFANPSARPYEYAIGIRCFLKNGKKKWTKETKWFQENACFSRKRAAAKKNKLALPLELFVPETEKFELYINPLNCYGGRGEALVVRDRLNG